MYKYTKINYLGHILAFISVAWLILMLFDHYKDINQLQWTLFSIFSFAMAICCGLLNVTASAYVWKIILSECNCSISFKQSFTIIGLSQIGKYIPGNVMQYFGRASLSTNAKMPLDIVLYSIVIETLIIVLSSLIIIVLGVIYDANKIIILSKYVNTFSVLRTTIIFSFIVIIIAMVLSYFTSCHEYIRNKIYLVSSKQILIPIIVDLSMYTIFGTIIFVMSHTFWAVDAGHIWFKFVWGFALASVIGFIMPGAPGGIGIREAVFVALFSAELGVGASLALAILLRLATGLADLATFAIAYFIRHRNGLNNICGIAVY